MSHVRQHYGTLIAARMNHLPSKLWDEENARVIGRLEEDRSAELRNERVDGCPARSFATIARDGT